MISACPVRQEMLPGDVAKDIMGADGGLTPTERRNRIYDMRVQVYSRDTIGVQSPVLTMTGTVIE